MKRVKKLTKSQLLRLEWRDFPILILLKEMHVKNDKGTLMPDSVFELKLKLNTSKKDFTANRSETIKKRLYENLPLRMDVSFRLLKEKKESIWYDGPSVRWCLTESRFVVYYDELGVNKKRSYSLYYDKVIRLIYDKVIRLIAENLHVSRREIQRKNTWKRAKSIIERESKTPEEIKRYLGLRNADVSDLRSGKYIQYILNDESYICFEEKTNHHLTNNTAEEIVESGTFEERWKLDDILYDLDFSLEEVKKIMEIIASKPELIAKRLLGENKNEDE